MQCATRLCHNLKSNRNPSRPMICRIHRMPSRLPKISRSAASIIYVSLPTVTGCLSLHRKSRLSLISMSPRLPLLVHHSRRRNSLLAFSVMYDSLHVSRLYSRAPLTRCHNRVLLPRCYHSRSHLHYTPTRIVSLEPITENKSRRLISRKSGKEREFPYRLRVAQS